MKKKKKGRCCFKVRIQKGSHVFFLSFFFFSVPLSYVAFVQYCLYAYFCRSSAAPVVFSLLMATALISDAERDPQLFRAPWTGVWAIWRLGASFSSGRGVYGPWLFCDRFVSVSRQEVTNGNHEV